jgi:predicted Zn-dependent protease
VLLIDDQDLHRLQQPWPVPYDLHGDILDLLYEFGAKAVFVDFAFLEASENEDQIAALVAHEISHVILGHHDLDYASNLQDGLVGATEVTMGAVRELGVISGRLGAKAELASIGARLLLAASSGVLLTSFNRE